MSIFYAKDSHSEILWILNKYKVLPMNVLFKKAKPCFTYSRFKKIINYLEEKQVVKTKVTHTDRKIKFVYPNPEVWNRLFPDQQMVVKSESLFHDAIVSKFIQILEERDLIYNFELPHQFDESRLRMVEGVEPDFYFSDLRTGAYAVEVELTLKSRSRYYEKFSRFLNQSRPFKLLYVTADRRIYDSLQMRFDEYCLKLDEESAKELRSIFYVLYVENLTTKENLREPNVEIFNFFNQTWHVDVHKGKLINKMLGRHPGVAERVFQN